MSLFNNKLSKVPLGMLDTDVQNKFTGYDTSLAEIMTQVINVKNPPTPMVAVKGDGVTNDTQAITNIYNSLGSRGGTLYFPNGDYKFNLTITTCNIKIEGSGRSASTSQGGIGGTRFSPYDLTKPVIQIGDGTATVNTISLEGISIEGDSYTTTSDGLVIHGAYYINAWDFDVINFGRDNIRIDSTSTQASFYINLDNFTSRWARGSAFKVVYGSNYVTSVNLSNFNIAGYNGAGSYAVYCDKATPNMTNGWLQAYNAQGHIYLTNGAYLNGFNINIDSDQNTDALVEVNVAPGLASDYLRGYILLDGKIKWNDGSLSPTNYTGSFLLPYHARMNYAHVSNSLLFGQSDGGGSVPDVINDSGPKLYRKGASPQETIYLTGAAFRPQLTYQYPLQPINGGSIWQNATTKQLRYRSNSNFPATDTDGVPFTTFQSVPASATATGNTGDIASDGTYLYICTATNTWKRVAIASW